MATDIVLRSIKAAALTHAEMDQNWESLAKTIDSQTSSYTVLVTDQNKIIEANISSGTITLPTVANAAGTDTDNFIVTVKNIHATSLTVTGNGSETIDGAGGVTLLTNECISLSLSANAVEWTIIAVHGPNLTGITASSTEINYNDITTLGTAQANKVMTTDASNNFNSTATVQATQITGTAVTGTTVTGTTVHASTTLKLGGVDITASAAELNTMDGITATAAELNYSAGVTSAIQTQFSNKQPLHSNLTGVAAATPSLNYFLVANGTTWITRPPSEARTSLGVDAAGTDNSTDVSLAGTPDYITISGQVLTRNPVDLTADVTGALPLAKGGSAASTAADAVINFGFTATAAEINAVCDANTATAAEITAICAGKTLTSTDDKIDNFPAGTPLLFQQTTTPSGWTKQTTHNDKALRIVSATAGSGGTQPFTTTFGSGKTSDSHILTTSEMPSHSHQQRAFNSGSGVSFQIFGGQPVTTPVNSGILPTTDVTGGGGGHTHNLTNFDLQYVDVIIGTKD